MILSASAYEYTTERQQWYDLTAGIREFMPSPKMKVITRLEFELANYEIAISILPLHNRISRKKKNLFTNNDHLSARYWFMVFLSNIYNFQIDLADP